MHDLSPINYGNLIEKELLSNSTHFQEYFYAKNLFTSLKSIKRQNNFQLNKPAKTKKSTFKEFALRLLLATSYSPVNSLTGNITLQNSPHINFDLQCNVNTYLSDSKSAVNCPEHFAPVFPKGNNTDFKFDYDSREKHDARRIIRSVKEAQAINLPPIKWASEELASLLLSGSLITAKELKSPYHIVKALDGFLANNNDALERVAQSLLKFSGQFGYKDQESLTQCQQQKIMVAWLKSFIFNNNVEKFIINEFMTIVKKIPGKAVSTRDFANHLFEAVEKLLKKTSHDYPDINHANLPKVILDNLLIPLMPTFFQSHVNASAMVYTVGSIEWGFFHAGLGLAMRTGTNLKSLSVNDILSLGIILEAMLKEGFTEPSLIKLFMIPAMLYHVKYCHDHDHSTGTEDILQNSGIKQDILTEYFSACDRYHAAKDPLACLSQRVDTYQSYADLADALENLDSNIELTPEQYFFSYYKYNVYGSISMDETISSKRSDWHIPDPDLLFDKQNIEIANAFATVDKDVIRDAFNGMNKNEFRFLNSSMVTLIRVSLECNSDLQKKMPDDRFHQIDELSIRKNVEVFSAQKDNEERKYALIKEKGEYQIRRINASITSYFDYLPYFKPELDTDSIKLAFSPEGNGTLKDTDDSLQVLAAKLSQIHRNKMLQHLSAYGYDNMANLERNAFFSSIIPFYTCSQRVQAAKKGTKKTLCGVDVAALSSIVGNTEMDVRAVIKTVNDSPTAMNRITSGLAIRQSFAMALKEGTSSLIKTIDLPASRELNPIALSKLGVEYLLIFDPSLEISSRLSEVMARQLAEGVAIASRSRPPLKRLNAAFAAKNDPSGDLLVKRYEMAYLPSLELEVPVVKVGGDTFEGKDIYLRLNPENNDIFSHKYTLAEDKTLIPVPMPQGENLHNALLHDHEEICTLIGNSKA